METIILAIPAGMMCEVGNFFNTLPCFTSKYHRLVVLFSNCNIALNNLAISKNKLFLDVSKTKKNED